MPIHDFRCPACGKVEEVYRSVKDETKPQCCGDEMEQFHKQAPMGMVRSDLHYRCMATGAEVTSARQRRNIMAKHGLVDANDFGPIEKQIQRANSKWAKIREEAAQHEKDNKLPDGIKFEDFSPATA